MLPGASYSNVYVRVRRTYTGERPRLAGKEKRFERDRLFSPRFHEFAENRYDIMQRESSAKSRYHRVSNMIIMYLKCHILS